MHSAWPLSLHDLPWPTPSHLEQHLRDHPPSILHGHQVHHRVAAAAAGRTVMAAPVPRV